MNDDLISRSALKEQAETVTLWNGDVRRFVSYETIDNAPTVEPQKIVTIPPELIEKLALCVVDTIGNIDWEKAIEAYKVRPQGEWNYIQAGMAVCPFCGAMPHKLYKDYCAKCGADMRGEQNEHL